MTNLKSFGPFTEHQIDSLRAQFEIVQNRVDLRRLKLYERIELDKFTKHQFHYRTSRVSIVMTVDQFTSGSWAYDEADEWIAFEDPADMTMFLLGYIEPDFKPARLV